MREKVWATLLAPLQHIFNPVMAEVTAALRATIFIRELGHQQVELEGNAIEIVHALKSE